MLPPTAAVLVDLVTHPTVAQALAYARDRGTTPLMPHPRVADGGIEWALVHAYTGAALGSASEPAGSEVAGMSDRTSAAAG